MHFLQKDSSYQDQKQPPAPRISKPKEMKKTVTFSSKPTDIETIAQRSPTEVNQPEPLLATQNQPQSVESGNQAADDDKAKTEINSINNVPTTTTQPGEKNFHSVNLKPILKISNIQDNCNQATNEPPHEISMFSNLVEKLAQLKASKPKEGKLLATLNEIFTCGLVILEKYHLDPTNLDTFLSTKEIFQVFSNFNYSLQFVNQSFQIASVLEMITREPDRVLQLTFMHLESLGTLMRDASFFDSKFLARIYVQIVRFYVVFLNKTNLVAKNYSNHAFRSVLQKVMKELLLNLKVLIPSDAPAVTKRSILLSTIAFYKDLNASPDIWKEFDFGESLNLLLNSLQVKDETVQSEKLDLIVAFVMRYPTQMLENTKLWFLQHVIINILADTINPFDEKVFLLIGHILMACVHKYCLYPENKHLFQALIFHIKPSELHALNNNNCLTLTFSEFEGNGETATIWGLLTSKLVYLQPIIKEKLVMDIWSALSLLCFNTPQAVSTKVDKKAALDRLSTGRVLGSHWIAVNTNAFLNFDFSSQKQALVSRRDLAFILFETLSEEKNPAKMETYITHLFELSLPENIAKSKNAKITHYYLQYFFKIGHLLSFHTYYGHLLCVSQLLKGLFDGFENLINAFPSERNKILMHETTIFQRMLQRPVPPDITSSAKKALSNFVIKLSDIDPLNFLDNNATERILKIAIRLIKTYPEVDYTSSVALLLKRYQPTYANTFALCDVFVALLSQCKNYEHLKSTLGFLFETLLSYFQQNIVSEELNETLFTRLLKQTKLLEKDFFMILQEKLLKTNLLVDTKLRVYASLIYVSKASDNLIKTNYPKCLTNPTTDHGVLLKVLPSMIPLVNVLPTNDIIQFVVLNAQTINYDVFENINIDNWSLQEVFAFLSEYQSVNQTELPLTSDKVFLSFFEKDQSFILPVLNSIESLFTNYGTQFERLAIKSQIVFRQLKNNNFHFSSKLIELQLKDLSNLELDTAIDLLNYSLSPLVFTQYKAQFSEWVYYARIDNEHQWLKLHNLLGVVLESVHGTKDAALTNEYMRLFVHTGHWSVLFNFVTQHGVDLQALSLELLSGLACFSKEAGLQLTDLLSQASFPVVSAIMAEWISFRNVYGMLMFLDQIIYCYVQGENNWNRDEKFHMITHFNTVCYLLSTYGRWSEYQLFLDTLTNKMTFESFYTAELLCIAFMQPNFTYRKQSFQKHAAALNYSAKFKSDFICPSIKLELDREVGVKRFETYYEDAKIKSEHFISVAQTLGAENHASVSHENVDALKKVTPKQGTIAMEVIAEKENGVNDQKKNEIAHSKENELLRGPDVELSFEPDFIDSSTQILLNTQRASKEQFLPAVGEKTITHAKSSLVACKPDNGPESFETISEYSNSLNDINPQTGFRSQALQHMETTKQNGVFEENPQAKSFQLQPIPEQEQIITSSNNSTKIAVSETLNNKDVPKQLKSNASVKKSKSSGKQVVFLDSMGKEEYNVENELESDTEKEVAKSIQENPKPEGKSKAQDNSKRQAKITYQLHSQSKVASLNENAVGRQGNETVEAKLANELEASEKEFDHHSGNSKEGSVTKKEHPRQDDLNSECDAESTSNQKGSSLLENSVLLPGKLNLARQNMSSDTQTADDHNGLKTTQKEHNFFNNDATNVILDLAPDSSTEKNFEKQTAKYESTKQNEKKHKITTDETARATKKSKVSVLQTSKVRKLVAAMRRFTGQDVENLSNSEKNIFKKEVARFFERL